ncbi:S-adenosylmethionine mitochondrial carrier [Paramuricea clavata]|uniref:S-adenosylmethionine mitochondrial carrier n=1 Tax=Paramuricea clavata TaxID=317549 RepID=A0A6S7HYI1_PARCT|nr:S-adenosylmethionine mitochondrial carrier [Paramuricea clavata]
MPEAFLASLLAGGTAGLCVDIALFPLDTIKTRVQSAQGFLKAGGFHGVYSGLGSAAAGSAPAAATFFCTYEIVKSSALWLPNVPTPYIHMVAASIGELTSNVVRVPFEVVKQRAQANRKLSSLQTFKYTWTQEGFKGLYRGYWNTVFREVPFSFIQYPLWEFLKMRWSRYQSHPVHSWQSSVCGAVSGGLAAALTTPLDVAKTRVMLAKKDCPTTKVNPFRVLILIGKDEGLKKLFSGIVPRVLWISIGGAIFLGIYDESRTLLNRSTER